MMRTQIPRFRLPESVTDEEVDQHPRHGRRDPVRPVRHRACKALLAEGWDAIFVGSRRAARPRARHSRPQGGRRAHPYRHRLAVVASRSAISTRSASRVIVLGGGNTAMDCCRSSRRLGGEEVTVVVRSGFEEMKASPVGERGRDARGHPDPQLPRARRVHPRERQADRRLVREGQGRIRRQGPAQPGADRRAADRIIPCDDVLVAIGQENAFPWIERDIGIEFDRWDMPKVDPKTMQSTRPQRVLRRRCGVRPEEHHLGGGARPRRGDLDRQVLPRRGCRRAAGRRA